jgi:hypothetical protein
MSNEKDSFTKAFGDLITKSIEANKVFLNEGSRFFKQINTQDLKANKFNFFQGDVLSNAVNQYVKLNLGHFNNLVDLGLSFIKNVNNTAENDSTREKNNEDVDNKPSFILEKEAVAGESVNFQFLLDNVKEEAVICQLINTGYSVQANPSSTKDFKTGFKPQTFDLKAGESKSVNITIDIPDETVPGLYISKVQVKGFEPAYFSIQITVTEKQKKQTSNGGKKAKPNRK